MTLDPVHTISEVGDDRQYDVDKVVRRAKRKGYTYWTDYEVQWSDGSTTWTSSQDDQPDVQAAIALYVTSTTKTPNPQIGL